MHEKDRICGDGRVAQIGIWVNPLVPAGGVGRGRRHHSDAREMALVAIFTWSRAHQTFQFRSKGARRLCLHRVTAKPARQYPNQPDGAKAAGRAHRGQVGGVAGPTG